MGKMIMNLKDSALGVEVSKASIRYYHGSRRQLLQLYNTLTAGRVFILCRGPGPCTCEEIIKTPKGISSYQRVNCTLLPMESPDGAPSVRATSQMTLQTGATISGEANQGRPTYAATVTTTNQSANAPRHPKESVIARITTHNGIPAVIFKVKDYYGIMAEECRLTIVGRFLKVRPKSMELGQFLRN
uniref:Uncharacterized protein n=1 Tax=Solanum tuberosum TaxID=4113 RepID=M1DGL7_SOLTU